MKKMMCAMMFVVIFITMNSCSADTAEGADNSTTTETLITNYTYNDSEIETMKLNQRLQGKYWFKCIRKNKSYFV